MTQGCEHTSSGYLSMLEMAEKILQKRKKEKKEKKKAKTKRKKKEFFLPVKLCYFTNQCDYLNVRARRKKKKTLQIR